jgi:hypothetical protein
VTHFYLIGISCENDHDIQEDESAVNHTLVLYHVEHQIYVEVKNLLEFAIDCIDIALQKVQFS